MRFNYLGQILLPLIIFTLLAAVSAGAFVTIKNQTKHQAVSLVSPTQAVLSANSAPASTSATVTTTPSPKPALTPNSSPIPTIDCVGPDHKHFPATKVECDNLNKAWASITPSTNSTSSSQSSSASNSNSTSSSGSSPTPTPTPSSSPSPSPSPSSSTQ